MAIQDTIQEDLKRMNSSEPIDSTPARIADNRLLHNAVGDKKARKAERRAKLDALRNSQFKRKK